LEKNKIMGFYVGPFHLITLLAIFIILFIGALYCVIKKKMGILSILTLIIFPIAGSLIIILYSIFNWKEKELLN